MSVNKVILVGRLGGDPQIKQTPSGKSVCDFTLATSEKWTKNGQKQEKTDWHRIVVWGKLADLAATFLRKGSMAYIEGKIQTRSYQDKNGTERHVTEIVADNIRFLDARKDASRKDAHESQDYDWEPGQDEGEGDLPF